MEGWILKYKHAMQTRIRRWGQRGMASAGGFVATFALTIAGPSAGESQILHNTRPPDTSAERLERPRPEQDSLRQGILQAQLTQREVVRLAQTTAKRKLGTSYEEFSLRSVMFDQQERSWTVTFTQNMTPFTPEGCLVVLVHDDSREMNSQPCRELNQRSE